MVASLVYRPSRVVVAPSAADRSFQNPDIAEHRPSRAAKALEQQGAPPRWLEVEQVGDVALVRFARRRILTEEAIETSAAQLFGLVENNRQHKLVLNFTNIDRLASAMLGKLILLQKNLQAVGGRVALCHIAPHLYEIFALLRVPRILTIYRGETEALEGFRRSSSHRWY
jgi:anti-anti-sigma regulatory factor